MKKMLVKKQSIRTVYAKVKNIVDDARTHAYRAVNTAMVYAYWNIGRVVIEEEQRGKNRAEYGEYLITELSKRLLKEFGDGFSEQNVRNFRQFYLAFPPPPSHKNAPNAIRYALRSELTWTHYRLLMRIENPDARTFYVSECIHSHWSTRQLEQQIHSSLFERLHIGNDKKKLNRVIHKHAELFDPKDFIKDPLVMPFLGFKKDQKFIESDIEDAIVNKLQEFLLELGKGFAFVARQQRITVGGDNFYIDLVFYNYILKCFLLIELKTDKLAPQDVGQMDFYVRYWEDKMKQKSDNPTIGLILCTEKNETVVRYSAMNDSKQLCASKYKLYFPTEKELRQEIYNERKMIEVRKLKEERARYG